MANKNQVVRFENIKEPLRSKLFLRQPVQRELLGDLVIDELLDHSGEKIQKYKGARGPKRPRRKKGNSNKKGSLKDELKNT